MKKTFCGRNSQHRIRHLRHLDHPESTITVSFFSGHSTEINILGSAWIYTIFDIENASSLLEIIFEKSGDQLQSDFFSFFVGFVFTHKKRLIDGIFSLRTRAIEPTFFLYFWNPHDIRLDFILFGHL